MTNIEQALTDYGLELVGSGYDGVSIKKYYQCRQVLVLMKITTTLILTLTGVPSLRFWHFFR